MSMDVGEQYDKIYRYCYFRLRNQTLAEDMTQETFLRFFEKYRHATMEQPLRCLYTIARNLCIDEYRRQPLLPLEAVPETLQPQEEQLLTSIALKAALAKLKPEEQELVLLRYVNEVPVSAIGQMLGISRFAVHRKLAAISKKLKDRLS